MSPLEFHWMLTSTMNFSVKVFSQIKSSQSKQSKEHKTKIQVIFFRDRQDHLKVFLHHMHPILQRQQLDYRIFIVEQAPGIKITNILPATFLL